MPSWKKKLPIQLTLSRVYILPFIIFFLYLNSFYYSFLAAILFIAASITDYFDGYYARKWNLVTNLGKFLDPVTDKILVISILIYLNSVGFVDPYLVIILTLRDTFIGGIRAAAATENVVIAAKSSGKWKTGVQMASIPAIMLGKSYKNEFSSYFSPDHFLLLGRIGYIFLWFSTVLSIISALQYYHIYKQNQSKG
ncbi:MAG: CDP-diacylglycerol--glycerol-3-phosphate 3-phosphatidyltransferase [Deltaproteobacteria bacterium]|jgi:CDP-diacylglycerol--glycerol-3-phosphate 3-phosphatidyltransferase|nr:CDP-diacylglycerol--glycerol-3-phosphate 3-phosphatidyltransferase [Deltaproteobacteria bacterium]